MNDQSQPWAWDETHWRDLVDQVRAGRNLLPEKWPNDARVAVALSFDSDHETNELRDGGKSVGRLSWGQYGNRKGVPRILDVLSRHEISATFFVPAVTALLHPDEQRRVIDLGHEIAIHGWIHELNSVLPYETEKDLMFYNAALRLSEPLELHPAQRIMCKSRSLGRCVPPPPGENVTLP